MSKEQEKWGVREYARAITAFVFVDVTCSVSGAVLGRLRPISEEVSVEGSGAPLAVSVLLQASR
ncbi:hypothetical protein EU78_11405 [Mycolicibacterium rufum]|nr:hypothetical protein EU78_11405 [Mycolicibacterium rufum]